MSDPNGRRPRALFLCPVFPDPYGTGLARRAWRWVAELSEHHALDIVVIECVAPLSLIPPLPGRVLLLRRTGAAIAPRRIPPRGLWDWFNPDESVAHALSGLQGETPERVVVMRFYLHDAAGFLPPAWREKAEMDCDDWEPARRVSLAWLALRHRRWLIACKNFLGAMCYAYVEYTQLSSYRKVHLSAQEDVHYLSRLMRRCDLIASPNLIAPEPGLAPVPPPAGARTLLFVGNLGYPPNEDALLWFGAKVLPRLRRLVPDVRVVAAGRADERLQKRLARDGIEYVHAPEHLAPLYDEAAVAIAPVRGGGGTKLKTLEAWLHERPLVATSHAARGVEGKHGTHFLVADRASDFAEACARLIQDPALGQRLVAAGRELLRARYLTSMPPCGPVPDPCAPVLDPDHVEMLPGA